MLLIVDMNKVIRKINKKGKSGLTIYGTILIKTFKVC